MNRLPRWRIVAGCIVLAALAFFAVLFAPVYIRNLRLQNYVDGITHGVGMDQRADTEIQGLVLQKAHELEVPLTADNVHIYHSAEGMRIDVRYAVTIHAPLYQVDIHFYPGAGSR